MAGGILGGKGFVGRLALVVCAFAGLLIAWSSQSGASDVGGQLLVGLPPGVKIETSVAAINCIDTSSFPGFTTTSWREGHNFTMDTFTFSHGCGARASWIKWDIKIGAPYNDTGSIWIGQNSAGSSYYAKCDGGFSKTTSCLTPNADGPPDGTRLALVPGSCAKSGNELFQLVGDHATCAAFGQNSTYPLYGVDTNVKVRNVGWDDCTISVYRYQKVLKAGEEWIAGWNEYPKGIGRCILIAQGRWAY
jgi:hypothetical protein